MTHQVLIDTLVQLPLGGPALPELLVVVFEALPVGAELLEAGLVDVLEAGRVSACVCRSRGPIPAHRSLPPGPILATRCRRTSRANVHTPGAAGHPAALLQALELAPARVLGLALHVVVIVVLASRADKERGRQKGGRAGTNLLDLGDRVWQRGGVVENLLVEAVIVSAKCRFHCFSQPNWRLQCFAHHLRAPTPASALPC
jgi:hypothetical protein